MFIFLTHRVSNSENRERENREQEENPIIIQKLSPISPLFPIPHTYPTRSFSPRKSRLRKTIAST